MKSVENSGTHWPTNNADFNLKMLQRIKIQGMCYLAQPRCLFKARCISHYFSLMGVEKQKELRSSGTDLFQRERSLPMLPTYINLYSCGLGGSIQKSQQINFNSDFKTLAGATPNNVLRNTVCHIFAIAEPGIRHS